MKGLRDPSIPTLATYTIYASYPLTFRTCGSTGAAPGPRGPHMRPGGCSLAEAHEALASKIPQGPLTNHDCPKWLACAWDR